MPEPIVRIHLPLEFSGGRLLDSNGDEVRHPYKGKNLYKRIVNENAF